MAYLGFISEPSPELSKFLDETEERLKSNSLLTNPFTTGFKQLVTIKGEAITLIKIEPVYFNYAQFGWLLAFGVFMFKGLSYWLIPGIILGCFGIFWSDWFYWKLLKLGIRKNGYKGKLVRLKPKEVIEKVIFQ